MQELDVFQCRHPARRLRENIPDEVTLHTCQSCLYRPKVMTDKPRVLILKNNLCPGDVLAMTAAVHSLHREHPGQYLTAVETSCPALWEFNPDVISPEEARNLNGEEVQMHYTLVNESNQRAVHFLSGYCAFLEHALKVPVPLRTSRPLVYLSTEEKSWMNQVQEQTGRAGPFWLVNAGVKTCYTAKQWPWYQEVVNRLQGKVVFVQVGKAEHVHRPLRGVIDLIGKTDDRQLVRLVHHARGVLGGVTFTMHLAAALEKPAVTLAGGREPRVWNTYPLQALLSSVGQLPCCQVAACWKSRTVALGDGADADKSLCENPTLTEPVSPRCMAIISPERVAEEILAFQA